MKAKLLRNGGHQLLTKELLIETIEKFDTRWAEPDLTSVTPAIPQDDDIFYSVGKQSEPKAGKAGKIKGLEEVIQNSAV